MSGRDAFQQYANYQHLHNESGFQPVSGLQNAPNAYQIGQIAYGSINPHTDTINQPSTPPRTPHKTVGMQYQQNMPFASGQESVNQPKSKGKIRSKKVAPSPAVSRVDGSTVFRADSIPISMVPVSAKHISTPTAAAYAGPTFHASPAPSTLPIPSFLSKSIPESPSFKGAIPDMSETSSSGEDSPTILTAQISKVPLAREESPLDLFFNADRAEKARAHSTSILGASGAATGPFQPPHASPDRSRPVSGVPVRSNDRSPSDGTSSTLASKVNEGSKPFGPAFSTPYAERINASRSGPSASQSTTQVSADRSDALKAFLFSGRPSASKMSNLSGFADLPKSPAALPSSPSSTPVRSQFPQGRYSNQGGNSRSSGLRQEVDITPTKTPLKPTSNDFPHSASDVSSYSTATPVVLRGYNTSNAPENLAPPTTVNPSLKMSTQNSQKSDLLEMEESLRRMLKLTPSQSRTPA